MKHNFDKYDDDKLTEMLQSKWKKNRDGAFTEIYNRYSTDIFIFLSKMLKSEAMINDFYQDTFISFFDYARQNKIINIRAFLRKTARNLAINYFRDKKETNKINIDLFEYDEKLVDYNNHEKLELKEIFDNALDQLAPDRREIFIMKYYMHCDYCEIERVTGKNASVASQLVYKAKNDLRILLKPYYKEIIEER